MAMAEGPFPYRCPPGEIWEPGGSNSQDFDYPFGGTSPVPDPVPTIFPQIIVSDEDRERIRYFYMTDDEKEKIQDEYLKKFGVWSYRI